ncbi:hypothetical protein TNCV_3563111 [Trichonephila clavipes]|nr:hypothetical protein TNCV_3563111 [Trichonephila clavipes]
MVTDTWQLFMTSSPSITDECLGYLIVVGLVTSTRTVLLNTRHVGDLSRAQTSSRWCGGVVRRWHRTLEHSIFPLVRRRKPTGRKKLTSEVLTESEESNYEGKGGRRHHFLLVFKKPERGLPVGDPRPDAVALYSGCTPGKHRAWFFPDDRHTACLVGLRGGLRHARIKLCFTLMDPMLLYPAKSFLDYPVSIVPKKSLNSCRVVIPEPDLLTTTDAKIFDGFSDQGVIQPQITDNNKNRLPKLQNSPAYSESSAMY